MTERAVADVLATQQVVLETALADASAFRVWLAAQAPDAEVGTSADALLCPVATWLQGLCSGDDVAVGVIGPYVAMFVDGLPFSIELAAPEWVDTFVYRLSCVVRDGESVVVAVALQVFDDLGEVG